MPDSWNTRSAGCEFAAVFGPSGSGKSSLLRAGLIPALQHSREPGLRPAVIQILTPGDHPARALVSLLDASRPGDGGTDTLVIVDQFEEVYTLCQDPAERTRFIDLLLAALLPASRFKVLIAVRADFYGRCAEHHALAGALRDANLLVTAMNRDELRDAIVKPAAAIGLTLERALTARIIEDVADESGALPLMSHALLETYQTSAGQSFQYQRSILAGARGQFGAESRATGVLGSFTGGDEPQQQIAGDRGLCRRKLSVETLCGSGDGTAHPADGIVRGLSECSSSASSPSSWRRAATAHRPSGRR
ncbi:hypothetical protein ADL00_40555 [Streptomyces sp. AS58]|nr:hypothetical protein ADL00_40555 [Streptomyces sp. AS58]